MRLGPAVLAAALLLAAGFLAVSAEAARLELPTIVVDLAHGQQANGVCAMMDAVPDAYWIIVVSSRDVLGDYASCIESKAYMVVEGDLTALTKLPSADMLIIGQPVSEITGQEKEAILNWLQSEGRKVLWCATDSDYPAQGGNLESAQRFCNDLLDYLYENGVKVHLRSDYVSIEDPESNAGRSYRVIAFVKPPARLGADILALGAEKVLMHGPGAVAWVDDNGEWHKVTDPNTPETIVPIIVTTDKARVVEHQPKNPGEPGFFGRAHTVGETGSFVLLAAELVKVGEGDKAHGVIFIVSGESPYYGYQSMLTYQYHGRLLDGPRFFRNLVLWSTGACYELKAFRQLQSQAMASEELANVKQLAEQANAKAEEAINVAQEAKQKAEEAIKKAEEAINKANTIEAAVNQLKNDVNNATARAGSAYGYAIGAIILAIVAILAAGLAIQKRGQA